MRHLGLLLCLLANSVSALAQGTPRPADVAIVNADLEGQPGSSEIEGWGSTGSNEGQLPPVYRIIADPVNPFSGTTSARIFAAGPPADGDFGILSQTIDAEPLRGRKLRLTAKVRVRNPAPVHAGLWLRVDREGGRQGFFDNMRSRPIISEEWREYEIEGTVAADATEILFGFLMVGAGDGWVDNFAIEDLGPDTSPLIERADWKEGPRRAGPIEGDVGPADISEAGIANLKAFARLYGLVRWFHPSDALEGFDWSRFLIAHIPVVEKASGPEQLAEALSAAFGPLAPTLNIAAGSDAGQAIIPESSEHKRWKHRGFEGVGPSRIYQQIKEIIPSSSAPPIHQETLTEGISISLPLSVPVNPDGRTLPLAQPPALPEWGKPDGWIPAGFDRTTRIAGVLSAWAMFDHFYPYWDVVDTDWEVLFTPIVQDAAKAPNDIAYADVLSRLTAGLKDGHALVYYHLEDSKLPLDWEWIEDKLVITAVTEGVDDLVPGMVVNAIDGVPAKTMLDREKALISGSEQWKTHIALLNLRFASGVGGRRFAVTDRHGKTFEIDVALVDRRSVGRARESKPAVVAELEPGILYVDLDRATNEQIENAQEQMANASGLIFDLRGYPRGGFQYLAHMIDEPIKSPHFNVPVQTRPDAVFDSWDDFPWTIEPNAPAYTRNIVWITSGGAISYAESILGTVKNNNLGTIVGGATAGANGNITAFRLPGGYRLQWTGMQVLNHDGSQHHLLGVVPDVEVSRTIAGVREGRDELLEAALKVVREGVSK